MAKILYYVAILFTLVGLVALPTYACSNHPPQKTSASVSSGEDSWLPPSSAQENQTGVDAKLLKPAKAGDMGKKAWSDRFFGGAPRKPASNEENPSSTQSWSSDID